MDNEEGYDIHAAKHKFAPDDIDMVIYKPKNDFYGMGFDPLKNAPEFRAARAQRDGVESTVSTRCVVSLRRC